MQAKNKQRVVFYISPEDKQLLQNQCELLQIKPSSFIRNCVREKLGQPIFEVKKRDLEIQNYLGLLLKIGVNLNQIAKKLNADAKFQIADQHKVLTDIESLKNHILEIKSQL